jgi:hypothetical protein
MPRRNIFSALDDYLVNPSDKRISDEIQGLSNDLVMEAKIKYLNIEKQEITQEALNLVTPDNYNDYLKEIVLSDAQKAAPSSSRLIQSQEKLGEEGQHIDAQYVYKVSDKEQALINTLIDKIKNEGTFSPLGLETTHSLFVKREAESSHKYISDEQAHTINSDHYKVMRLKRECSKYLAHLESSINDLAKELPPQARERNTTEETIDVGRLISTKKQGMNLIWVTDKESSSTHSNELYPALYIKLDKYEKVKDMLDCLNKNNIKNDAKLEQFSEKLSASKVKLSENSDSAGIQFLKNVLHILSLGIYSKATKGTFAFWKTHGEAFSDKAEEVQSSTLKPS